MIISYEYAINFVLSPIFELLHVYGTNFLSCFPKH